MVVVRIEVARRARRILIPINCLNDLGVVAPALKGIQIRLVKISLRTGRIDVLTKNLLLGSLPSVAVHRTNTLS